MLGKSRIKLILTGWLCLALLFGPWFQARAFEDGNAARELVEIGVKTGPGWTPVVIEGGKYVLRGAATCLGATLSAVAVGLGVLFVPTNHYDEICPIHAPENPNEVRRITDQCNHHNLKCFEMSEDGSVQPWTGTEEPSRWERRELEEGLAGYLNDPEFQRRLEQWRYRQMARTPRGNSSPRFVALDQGAGSSGSAGAKGGAPKKREKPKPEMTPEELAALVTVDPEVIQRVLLEKLPESLLAEGHLTWENGDLFPSEESTARGKEGIVAQLEYFLDQGQWREAVELVESLGDIEVDDDSERDDVDQDEEDGIPEEEVNFEITREQASEMVYLMLPELVRFSLSELHEEIDVILEFRFFPDHMRKEVYQRILDKYSFESLRPDGYVDFWDNLIAGTGSEGDSTYHLLKRMPHLARALLENPFGKDLLGMVIAIEITAEFVRNWDHYVSALNRTTCSGADVSTLLVSVMFRLWGPEGRSAMDHCLDTNDPEKYERYIQFTEKMGTLLNEHIDEVMAGRANGNGRMSQEIAYRREALIDELGKMMDLSKVKASQLYDEILQEVMHVDRDPLGLHHPFPTLQDATNRAKAAESSVRE